MQIAIARSASSALRAAAPGVISRGSLTSEDEW
jgi:hypothetical protein